MSLNSNLTSCVKMLRHKVRTNWLYEKAIQKIEICNFSVNVTSFSKLGLKNWKKLVFLPLDEFDLFSLIFAKHTLLFPFDALLSAVKLKSVQFIFHLNYGNYQISRSCTGLFSGKAVCWFALGCSSEHILLSVYRWQISTVVFGLVLPPLDNLIAKCTQRSH